MAENRIKELLRNITLAIILGAVMILVPLSLALGKKGFDKTEIFSQFNLYVETGSVYLIVVLAIFFFEYIVRKGDEKYGSSICFASPGENPSPGFFKRLGNFQMFLLFFIAFSVLGLFNFLTKQQVFIGVGTLQQQFTNFDNLLFSSTLVTISENLGGAMVIALSLMGLRILGRKYNLNKGTFQALSLILIPFLIGIYGLINHLSRGYGDVSNFNVFVIWTLGGFLTVISGSFIPFWTLHISNNVFYDLKKFFSFDLSWASIIIMIIFLVVIYFLLYNPFNKKKKKESEV